MACLRCRCFRERFVAGVVLLVLFASAARAHGCVRILQPKPERLRTKRDVVEMWLQGGLGGSPRHYRGMRGSVPLFGSVVLVAIGLWARSFFGCNAGANRCRFQALGQSSWGCG